MKNIELRQYYYGGDYSIIDIEVPDDTIIYEVSAFGASHKVQDKEDTWTYAIVIESSGEMEDSIKMGTYYYRFETDIYVLYHSFIPKQNIESKPWVYNTFIVERAEDRTVQEEIQNLVLTKGISSVLTEDTLKLKELINKSTVISEIDRVIKLTRTGLLVARVLFKSWLDLSDIRHMSISEIPYNKLYNKEFTSEPKISNMFRERAESIYDSIIFGD